MSLAEPRLVSCCTYQRLSKYLLNWKSLVFLLLFARTSGWVLLLVYIPWRPYSWEVMVSGAQGVRGLFIRTALCLLMLSLTAKSMVGSHCLPAKFPVSSFFFVCEWYFHIEPFSWTVQICETLKVNIGIRDKLPCKYALFGKGVCQVHVAELDQKRMLLYSPSKNSYISLRGSWIVVPIPKWLLSLRNVCLMEDMQITEMLSLWDEHRYRRAVP